MYSLATQKIGLESVINARELGGYKLPGGGRVRRGLLLRGGPFAALTPQDRAILRDRFHLALNCDFRTETEVGLAPDRPVQGAKHLWFPIIDPDSDNVEGKSFPAEAFTDLENFLVKYAHTPLAQQIARNLYVDMVMNSYSQEQYAGFMRAVTDTGQGAVYWHCSQGKDRTGLAAAFILCALGADRELILEDYRISEEFYRDEVERVNRRVSTPEEKAVIRTFIGVNEEYFVLALDMIDQTYGSLEAYLKGPLRMTDEDFQKLRGRFLE